MSKKVTFVDGVMVEYEIYPLIDSYDPRLRQPTPLIDFKKEDPVKLLNIVYSLMKTLDHYEGLGLSANQCGLPYRICVVSDLKEGKNYPLINPVVVESSPTLSKYKEGCLSFPGLFLEIGRPEWCVVQYQDTTSNRVTKRFEGIYATCVQHEIDHLNGICYTDLIPKIKLDMVKRKVNANLRKIRRATTGS